MMVVHRHTGQIENKHFRDVIEYFDDKDVFVVNNTKVFPARMYGRKEKTGAKIEVFLLRELNKPNRLWDVIVDPARTIRVGNKLYFGENEPFAFFGKAPTKNFGRCSKSSAKHLCRNTSNANPTKKTKNVTKPFTPSTKGPLPHLQQDCTSARSLSNASK